MEALDFIINAVNSETGTGKKLEAIKHVSSTEHEKIAGLPAVFVFDAPFDYNQIFSQNYRSGLEKQKCHIVSMVKLDAKSFSKLTDAENRAKTLEAKQNLNKVIDVIYENIKTTNGIASMSFAEPAEKIDAVIGEYNVIYWDVVVEVTLLTNS